MPQVSCPACGEDEELSGRRDDERIPSSPRPGPQPPPGDGPDLTSLRRRAR